MTKTRRQTHVYILHYLLLLRERASVLFRTYYCLSNVELYRAVQRTLNVSCATLALVFAGTLLFCVKETIVLVYLMH
jgi:hypothetical protein